jgi:hypothetical protein
VNLRFFSKKMQSLQSKPMDIRILIFVRGHRRVCHSAIPSLDGALRIKLGRQDWRISAVGAVIRQIIKVM